MRPRDRYTSLLLALGALLIAAASLAGAPRARAQSPAAFTWVRTLNGTGEAASGTAFGVAFDGGRNVVAVGQVGNNGASDFTVVKYDPAGNQRWVRTLPGRLGGATAVAVDSQDAVIAAGGREVGGVFQAAIAKWDAQGNLLWSSTFSPDANTPTYSQAVALDQNGDVIVGGGMGDILAGTARWVVARFRGTDGVLLWTQSGQGIPGFGNNVISAVAVDSGGNVAAAGLGQVGGGPFGFLVLRLRGSDGTPFWSLFDGDPNAFDEATSVAVDRNDNVVAGGRFSVLGQQVFAVAKYDRDTGARLWLDQAFGAAPVRASASAVRINSQGNPVAVGFADLSPRVESVAAAAYANATGAALWRTTVPPASSTGFAFANDGALDPLDRLAAGGGAGESDEDFAVWQFDAAGNLEQTRVLPSNGDGEALAIAADAQGNVAAAGYVTNPALNDVQFTVAYAGPGGPGGGAAADLRFGQQPTDTAAGTPIKPPVTVRIIDAAGGTVPGATGPVTLTLAANPGGATLGGTLTVATVNGIATFSDLTLDKVANGYTLRATTPTLPGKSTVSNPFNVIPGEPSDLVFGQQPTNTEVGQAIAPPVTVRIVDASGNTVTTATASVTLALGANPGGATLGGTTTVGAASGVATFSTLTLDKQGTGYTLQATTPLLPGKTSASTPFNVGAKEATHFRVTAPASVAAGVPFTFSVTALDESNAPVPGYRGTVRLTSSDPAAALPANTAFTIADAGMRTFTAALNSPGSRTLTAADLATPSITGSATIGVQARQDLVVTTDQDAVSASDGRTSLREAILVANARPGLDTIRFNIPGPGLHTIRVQPALPKITDPVVIDAYTQPQARANTAPPAAGTNAVILIEIDGTKAPAGSDGLWITAGGSTVRGLVINRFRGGNGLDFREVHGAGIRLEGTGGNRVIGCFLGADRTGMPLPPGSPPTGNRDGVFAVDSTNNTIGGTAAADRNVLSANSGVGVHLFGPGASGNRVQGNLIGMQASGAAALGNTVGVYVVDAPNNLIGGPAPGAGNVVGGNNSYGIALYREGATGNLVQGNRIGTNAAGTAAVRNPFAVLVIGASRNRIGGAQPGEGNIVSGGFWGISINGVPLDPTADEARENVVQGNRIGTNAGGSAALANVIGVFVTEGASDALIGGETPGARNVISGNTSSGIRLSGVTEGNRVQGNRIGTDPSGNAALPNGAGIDVLSGARNNLIGGYTAGARNLISGNQGDGVLIQGTGATANRIAGNFIGTNAAGTSRLPNNVGVHLTAGAGGNRVGGTEPGSGNLASGNQLYGVLIDGSATGNFVLGNRLGTNAAGTAALGNGIDGVNLQSPGNTVGGAAPGAGNLISGNGFSGIGILGNQATGNVVQGNLIGTNAAGTGLIGHPDNGITLAASNNTIGGPGVGNVISGNGRGILVFGDRNVVEGNRIGTNLAGTTALPNSVGVQVWGSLNNIGGAAPDAGNLISGNLEQGVRIERAGSAGNRVAGNRIGTIEAGTAALPNLGNGVEVSDGASGNFIGGLGAGSRNVISGNRLHGVSITGGTTTGNTLHGNVIGLDPTGSVSVANRQDGVFIQAHGNTVGGTATGAGNVISGNLGNGVTLWGNVSRGNTIQGNRIGTNAAGTAALGNAFGVFVVAGAAENTLGGAAPGAGNLISGNNGGVSILAPRNVAQGNFIGTNAVGTAAVPNKRSGIVVQAQFNTIGGVTPSSGNLISGNGEQGILITTSSGTGNVVQGNFIGTNAAGTSAVPNSQNGVLLEAGGNTIGGALPGGNRIAFNGGDGVRVAGSVARNGIRLNTIFSNGRLGINLVGGSEDAWGVTRNDLRDLDDGPNGLQNAPVLTGVAASPGGVTLTVTLNSTPGAEFVVEIYRSPSPDPSGSGEGEVWLASVGSIFTHAQTGNATFSVSLFAPPDAAGQYYTAIASRRYPGGVFETSEFSKAVKAP